MLAAIAALVLPLLLSVQPAPAQAAQDKALALSLSRAFAEWFEHDRAAKGGRFLIYDAEERAVLDLETVALDDGDHLHRLDDGRFLSWGEFKDGAGHAYMLDFYFRRSGELFVFDHEITIFSRNKVKRYGWDETGPAMKKVPAK
jgi:hypothetical protein